MKSINLLPVFILVLFIISCGPSRNDYQENISKLEEEFSDQSSGLSKAKAQMLADAYIEYSEKFPDDSMSAEYLFKAADISMNITNAKQAISLYDEILAKYPDFRKAPQCVFLKAFVYENNLNDLVNAEKYYMEFLEKYPNDDFADDAQISLDNLGKSPEELIREFEEKMKQQENIEE